MTSKQLVAVEISATDFRRLAGYGKLHGLFDDRTLARVRFGKPVRESSLARVLSAAAAIGIDLHIGESPVTTPGFRESNARPDRHDFASTESSAQAG